MDLVAVVVLVAGLGLAAQWIAWRLRLPAIVLLLAAGILAGPVLGVLRPAEQLGPMLRPVVDLSVALILFEGGLNLRLSELKKAGAGVRRLVLLGVPIAWVLGSAAARVVAGLSWPVALVFGAIVVVTGPTVILPLLRHARLARRPASFLRWEGIVNDPIGVLLAVLVYEVVLSGREGAVGVVLQGLGVTIAAAAVLGAGGGWALTRVFRRGGAPEYLKGPIVLGSALVVFLLGDLAQKEAGLAAVTALGVVLGNSRLPSMDEIRRFKEGIILLLVAVVFLLLTANLDPGTLGRIDLRLALLLACLLLVVRPATVFLATVGTDMELRERLLVGWIAPRGIVAAAVAAAFAPELARLGHPDAELLVPLTFGLILVTVTLHGLTIGWLARRLGLASATPHGLLLVGANPWSIELARTLKEVGVTVLLVDANWHRLRTARMAGLEVSYGEILSERSEENLELNRIGVLLAVTANDAYNALVSTRFAPDLGRDRVFQLPVAAQAEDDPRGLLPTHRGRIAFGSAGGYDELLRRHFAGWRFQRTRLTETYGAEELARDLPAGALRLLHVREDGALLFDGEPGKGDTVVTYAPPDR
jgi:NhaP-type Na+/H+ or K+/H+ antiporter